MNPSVPTKPGDPLALQSVGSNENLAIKHPHDLIIGEEWTMHYKHGPTPHVQKNFKLKGTLRQAIDRAQYHCRVMNYRLIQVNPMFVNLAEEETSRIPSAAQGFGKNEATF